MNGRHDRHCWRQRPAAAYLARPCALLKSQTSLHGQCRHSRRCYRECMQCLHSCPGMPQCKLPTPSWHAQARTWTCVVPARRCCVLSQKRHVRHVEVAHGTSIVHASHWGSLRASASSAIKTPVGHPPATGPRERSGKRCLFTQQRECLFHVGNAIAVNRTVTWPCDRYARCPRQPEPVKPYPSTHFFRFCGS